MKPTEAGCVITGLGRPRRLWGASYGRDKEEDDREDAPHPRRGNPARCDPRLARGGNKLALVIADRTVLRWPWRVRGKSAASGAQEHGHSVAMASQNQSEWLRPCSNSRCASRCAEYAS
jgi:hypothetical protein